MTDKNGKNITIGSRVISSYTGDKPVPVVAIHSKGLFVRVLKWDGEPEWLMSRDIVMM